MCTGIKGKMTGVNLAEASQPSRRSGTHWAPFHKGTHREGLVLRPMCRSESAGRSEMIGLPRDAAQRTHCFPPAKASTGMQYRAAGNFQFIAYLYRKSSNPRKAPACRLTLWWEFRKRGRWRAGPDRHQTELRISFFRKKSQRWYLCLVCALHETQ